MEIQFGDCFYFLFFISVKHLLKSAIFCISMMEDD